MIEWIIQNKSWVFDGIGAAIFVFILSLVIKNNSISQKQKGGKNSKNIQIGNIEK